MAFQPDTLHITYSKLRADLEVMVETWNDFIRLAVISKDPQPSTVEEREILKREIDQQTKIKSGVKEKKHEKEVK